MKTVEFVIFDLDGTLVDSEALCNRAFIDLLPELGAHVGTEDLIRMNRGRKLAEILTDLEETFGLSLDEDFTRRYRSRVEALFSSELKPVEGVPDMLDALDRPRCVASSGPPEKMRHALEVCGLSDHFRDNIHSSYEVRSWKPDPGLFQFAMRDAGFRPEQCAVVEDSDVGIRAASAAGAQPFLYAPERACSNEGNCIVFGSMVDLVHLMTHASGQQ